MLNDFVYYNCGYFNDIGRNLFKILNLVRYI